MKFSQLIAELKSAGCYITRHGGNHDIWFSPKTGKTFPVARHGSQEIPKGTEKQIRRVAGL